GSFVQRENCVGLCLSAHDLFSAQVLRLAIIVTRAESPGMKPRQLANRRFASSFLLAAYQSPKIMYLSLLRGRARVKSRLRTVAVEIRLYIDPETGQPYIYGHRVTADEVRQRIVKVIYRGHQ